MIGLHSSPETSWQSAVAKIDWPAIGHSLDLYGSAELRNLLTSVQCDALSAMYAEERGFRSRIVMARHGFGQGEYKYFSYPLEPVVAGLRETLYPHLVPIANRWNSLCGEKTQYPDRLEEFLARCHAAGQTRPTPLLLRYQVGDYNCLHRDLYGEHVFPIQVAILLSEPGIDFEGGEFILAEESASGRKVDVIPLTKGDAVVFAVSQRPTTGYRGRIRKAVLRHGVSALRSGTRHTLGIIFHDAQ